jgi:hypothetical protein
MDMRGEVILNTYLKNISEPIDISSLQKGAYFLIIETPEERFSGKLLVK